MAKLDLQNRTPSVSTLPDLRLRVTEVWDVLNYVPKTPAALAADITLPWATPHSKYTNCLLIKQDIIGQIDNPATAPNQKPPQLIRVFEQIHPTNETEVGNVDVSFDQNGIKSVVRESIQFSTGTTPVYETVGTTPAPSPNASALLQSEERTDNGTVQQIKRTYIDDGYLSDLVDIRFNGKVLVRTITTVGIIPPTPTGYTLVGPGVEHPDGREVYVYKFASAAASAGGGGTVSDETEYKLSPDGGTTGVTVRTISYVTDPSITSNPIATPSGFTLIDVRYSDDSGYRMWTAVYAKGQGLISSEIDYRNKGLLVIYTRTSLNIAPTAPGATIGGTVVLIGTDTKNGGDALSGTTVYRSQWAEGKGVISNEVQGESDGALIYTVTELGANALTPAYPGAGTAHLVSLDQRADTGHYVSRAVYKKPPATQTFKKQFGFEWPGVASFTGSPPQFVMQPPANRTLLANVEVSYDVAQISDVPFSVTAYATFYETYTPTATGIPVQSQRGLGGYLAGASSISGTSSDYNGVPCDSYAAVLISSIPSSLPTGLTVIHTDNDPYLTATNGTVVYRRTKISYTF